jgi:hypothetical protein
MDRSEINRLLGGTTERARRCFVDVPSGSGQPARVWVALEIASMTFVEVDANGWPLEMRADELAIVEKLDHAAASGQLADLVRAARMSDAGVRSTTDYAVHLAAVL